MNGIITCILIALCCSVALLSPYLKKSMVIMAVIIGIVSIVLMAGRSVDVVPDTNEYVDNFEYIDTSSSFFDVQANYHAFENGFMALNLLVKKAGQSYRCLFAVVMLIELLLIIKASILQKRAGVISQEYYALYLALFLGYFGIFYGGIAIRSGIALALVFLGNAYLLLEKKIIALICSILAFQFHHSVIILIVAIFICDKFYMKSTKWYRLWWGTILLIWLARIGLMLNRLLVSAMGVLSNYFTFMQRYTADWYTKELMGDGFLSKKNILYLLIGLVLVIRHSKKKSESYNKILTLYMVGLTLTFLLNEYSSGYRLSDMFLIYAIPLMVDLVCDSGRIGQSSRSLLGGMIVLAQFVISLRITGIVF